METASEGKQRLEAVLFASNRPVELEKLKAALDGTDGREIAQWTQELKEEYERTQRAFTIIEVAGGYQMVARQEFIPWITKLYKPKAERLSGPALETLAIIAYRQPITRSEMEVIRGVNVDGVIQTLVDRALIRSVGRREAIGRPILYGTTRLFLEHFGLNSLEELPKLPEASLPETVQAAQTQESHDPQTASPTH